MYSFHVHRIHHSGILGAGQFRFCGVSAVTVRGGEGESVGEMTDFPHRAVLQQHFHDVKTNFYGRIFQKAQVVQRALGKSPALARVHPRGGTLPIFRGTGFDFNENQTICTLSRKHFADAFWAGVPENQINLPTLGTEIGGEEFQALPLQKPLRRPLPQFATSQMFWLRLASETRFEHCQEIHQSTIEHELDAKTMIFKKSAPLIQTQPVSPGPSLRG